MGLIPILGLYSTESWHSRSWFLSDLLGETAARSSGFILYLASLIGFVAAGLGLLDWLVPHDLWANLAIASAVLSLITIILFWNGLVSLFPNKIGALAINIAVLVSLLLLRWPSEADLGT